ncbi:MAG: carcinine hydrolase/isopenicillin-N N-acyltransferase family protein [Oscillospiraceae bacterium]|nr:carcinine hydrolase/isopenicillin-N N-acyltransferase family protein [Oscillospiraceae bacterium]
MKTHMKSACRTAVAAVLAVLMVLTCCASFAFAAGPKNVYTGDPHSYRVTPNDKVVAINDNTKVTKFKGDDKVDEFLEQGGAGSIQDLVLFLARNLAVPALADTLNIPQFGCSSLQISNGQGGYLFGRNFDYSPCGMYIVEDEPTDGYKSISTADMDFITSSLGDLADKVPDSVYKRIALWIPLDGMNEKGLTISVNMIADDAVVNQDSGKTNQICISAIRTILDKAATVDEALNILKNSDFHTWDGFMIHLAITDATGKHCVVEYINNQMSVVDSPINTNFYLTQGPKYGIGTAQSMIRYKNLVKAMADHPTMDKTMLRDTMHSVAKSNFSDDEHTTEWTSIYDQQNLTATYYRQENYKVAYNFYF